MLLSLYMLVHGLILLIRINAKLGGKNTVPEAQSMNYLGSAPTMVLGKVNKLDEKSQPK
jgi:hypothetical protein